MTVQNRDDPVVIVEPEAVVAMMMDDSLRSAGHRTLWVPTVGKALSLFGRLRGAKAAIVGMWFPDGVGGRDLLRRLRRLRPALPAVVLGRFQPSVPQSELRGVGGPTERIDSALESAELLRQVEAVADRPEVYIGPERRAALAARRASDPAGALAQRQSGSVV